MNGNNIVFSSRSVFKKTQFSIPFRQVVIVYALENLEINFSVSKYLFAVLNNFLPLHCK